MVLGYRIRSRNRNTHGQTRYSLGRQSLTFKIMVKKVKVFILFLEALNKRMIDLAEQAGAEFSSKKSGMLCLKLLYT
jgi:hypothetical protein